MQHIHKYDAQGKQLCCTQEEKINLIANKQLKKEHKRSRLLWSRWTQA